MGSARSGLALFAHAARLCKSDWQSNEERVSKIEKEVQPEKWSRVKICVILMSLRGAVDK